MEPRLKSFYKSQILPELKNSLGVKNTMQVPKVLKIVINMGLGLDANDNKILKNIETDLANIESPNMPDRDIMESFFAHLGYCQFDVHELRSGYAWGMVNEISSELSRRNTK